MRLDYQILLKLPPNRTGWIRPWLGLFHLLSLQVAPPIWRSIRQCRTNTELGDKVCFKLKDQSKHPHEL